MLFLVLFCYALHWWLEIFGTSLGVPWWVEVWDSIIKGVGRDQRKEFSPRISQPNRATIQTSLQPVKIIISHAVEIIFRSKHPSPTASGPSNLDFIPPFLFEKSWKKSADPLFSHRVFFDWSLPGMGDPKRPPPRPSSCWEVQELPAGKAGNELDRRTKKIGQKKLWIFQGGKKKNPAFFVYIFLVKRHKFFTHFWKI